MTSRERILCALNRQEPDRVPIAMRGLEPLCHLWRNPFERALMLRDRFGIDDFLYARKAWPYGREVREERRWETGAEGKPILSTTYRTPAGPLTLRVVMTEDYNVDRVHLAADQLMPRSVERLIKDRDDLPRLQYLLADPAECKIPDWDETVRRYVEFGRREGFPVGVYIESFSGTPMKLVGPTELVMLAVENDPLVDEILDLFTDYCLKWIDYAARFGPDIVYHSGYLESTDFWSPELFRRYFAPRQKLLAERAHAHRMKYVNYITTGLDALTEEFRGLGIDCLYGWDPVPPGDADMRRLKCVLGGEMAFWGGISPTMTVERGTEEDVRSAVREAISTMAPGGGYILCTGGSVYFEEQAGIGGAKWQGAPESSRAYKNLLTLFRTALEYGRYPIGVNNSGA